MPCEMLRCDHSTAKRTHTLSHFPWAHPWSQVAGPQGTSSGTAPRVSSPEQNPTLTLSPLGDTSVLSRQPTSAQVQPGYYINFYIIKRGPRSHCFLPESSLQVANMSAFGKSIASLHTPEAAQPRGLGDTYRFLISVLRAEFFLVGKVDCNNKGGGLSLGRAWERKSALNILSLSV